MKYKVGDKVRIREDLNRYMRDRYITTFIGELNGKEVTICKAENEMYKILEDKQYHDWTDEMFEPVEEMSAVEAIKLYAEKCSEGKCSECSLSGKGSCTEYIKEHPEEALEVIKQWKADHEKKPIETEFAWYIQIIETDTHTLKHEEAIETDIKSMDERKAEILKKWCSEHDGKYYAISERRCVVKE